MGLLKRLNETEGELRLCLKPRVSITTHTSYIFIQFSFETGQAFAIALRRRLVTSIYICICIHIVIYTQ